MNRSIRSTNARNRPRRAQGSSRRSRSPADPPDEYIARLTRLFREHPAWIRAANSIDPDATSTVYFSHLPGEPWRLERRGSDTFLCPGAARDPDLSFRFTPRSIERLESVDGDIGDFALALFTLMTEDDPDQRVELRIVASFPRLWKRGYVRLLVAAGPKITAFGARHGIWTLGALRRFVTSVRSRNPAAWEC